MVYVIPKNKLPKIQYIPVEYPEEVAMMGNLETGLIIFFTASNEVVFAPWKELVTYAATAVREEPEQPKEEPTKKPLREVKPDRHN